MDLLLGERPHFLAVDRERAEHRVAFQERQPHRSASAEKLDRSHTMRVSPAVSLIVGNVGDLQRLLGRQHPSEARQGARPRRGTEVFGARFIAQSLHRDALELITRDAKYDAALGRAKSRCILEDDLEYRLHVRW